MGGVGGFGAVFDATGHTAFGAAQALIRPGGSFASTDLGRAGHNLALAAGIPVARRLGRRHVRFPLPHADAALGRYLRDLMMCGAYRPVVDRTCSFQGLREAYAYVDSGRKVGNVVVTMPPP